MIEVRGAVARCDEWVVQTRVVEGGALKGVDGLLGRGDGGGIGRREGVPGEVDDGGGEILDGTKTLAEGLGFADLGEQLVRDDLAGDNVAGVALDHGRVESPVLVDLGGEFHPVARDAGAGEGGVAHVGEQAVQCVTELVEDGVELVLAQAWLGAVRGLGKTHDVDDDGLGAKQMRLSHELAHPRTAALGRPAEVVGEQQTDTLVTIGGGVLAFVEDLPDAHALGVAFEVLARDDGDAVEAVGRGEDSILENAVEREVLAQLVLVEGEVAGADLGFPVGPVGGTEVLVVQGGFLGEQLFFAGGVGLGGRGELDEHAAGGLGGLRGLLGDDVIGMCGVAQQLRALGAQAHHLGEHVQVVLAAAGARGCVDLGARRGIGQARELRLHGGQLEREHVAVLAYLVGVGLGCLDAIGGQALELLRAVEAHGAFTGGRHEVAAELLGERRESLVDDGKLLFFCRAEVRALARKSPQQVRVEALRLLIGRRGRLFEAGVEDLILVDRIRMRGDLRPDLRGDLFHLVRDIRARQVAEDGKHAL